MIFALPPHQQQAFHSALVQDFDSIMASVAHIDAEKAEAGDPRDKVCPYMVIINEYPRVSLHGDPRDKVCPYMVIINEYPRVSLHGDPRDKEMIFA